MWHVTPDYDYIFENYNRHSAWFWKMAFTEFTSIYFLSSVILKFTPPISTTMYFVPTGCESRPRMLPLSDLSNRQKTEAAFDSLAMIKFELFIPAWKWTDFHERQSLEVCKYQTRERQYSLNIERDCLAHLKCLAHVAKEWAIYARAPSVISGSILNNSNHVSMLWFTSFENAWFNCRHLNRNLKNKGHVP